MSKSEWQIPEMSYCAYADALTSATSDAEALRRCEEIQKKCPKHQPDHYSTNMWGPLHVSVGRKWKETTRWLLPHCSSKGWDDWSENVFQYCYTGGNVLRAIEEPSIEMAKILVEEGEHDPRALFVSSYNQTKPLFEYGEMLIETLLEKQIFHAKWQELDAYFKQKSFEFQQKTGQGVSDFPILQESDLQAA